MKRKLVSFIVLISMLLVMVSSAVASPIVASTLDQVPMQPASENVIARVYYYSRAELDTLASRYDIIEVNQASGYVVILLSLEELASLEKDGYKVEIDESKTKLLTQNRQALPGQGPDEIPGYPCYRTVEETFIDMQAIVDNYPDLVQIFDIGDSWTRVQQGYPNGYDILALRLTNENFGVINDKPTFFLMAEIHAREYVTAEAAMRYAEHLISNYGIDPDITWLLDYFKVYIVTMTNPDGRKKAEDGQLWRKNVDNDDGCPYADSWGVDLNRNHTFSWNRGGSSPYACDETYMGPAAGSEPETQAIESFIRTIFADQRGPLDTDPAPADTTGLFITLHSYSQLVLWPWGFKSSPAPNGTQLQTLGRHLAFFNDYNPQQSYQLYLTSGTSDENAYGELGIAGYTYEMGTDFFQGCGSFESTIYPDNRDSLLYAFKAARRPYMNPAGPDSLSVLASPGAASPGEQVLLTATANDTRYGGAGEPTQNIAEARYSIDNPSWIQDTITYPMTASDGSFNAKVENIQATIDTTGLSSGRHTIFVESKDTNNNWGVPSAAFLYIIEPGVSPVIEGYVREASTNMPLSAEITAGMFSTTSDPATGYYSMTVISGTYDMVATAANFSPAYANGVLAENYQTIQQDFLLYPFCTIFSDDVENGNPDNWWTAQPPWAITTQASHSPTHSWTDSPGGNYGDNKNISLTSQTIDLTGYTGVSLGFWHKYVTEQGWDFASVEYDSGSGWSQVASYDGSHNTWTQEQLQLPGLDGQSNARIRFHFTTDSNTTYDGWYIDDIALMGGGPACVSIYPPTADFSTNSPVELGHAIQFTNLTTGTVPITYTWDFGDGVGTSTETDPSYTYLDFGTYTVTLDATSPYGTSEIAKPVVVEPVESINSVYLNLLNTEPILPGNSVNFSADLLPDNAGKPFTYTIDFSDGLVISGTSSLDPFPFDHVYTTSGRYPVQISVQNAGMVSPVVDELSILVPYRNLLPLTAK